MIKFGPSGNDVLFYQQGNKTSVQAPAWLASMGLTAFEVNFGRGVKMGDKMAAELGAEARKHNIAVSFHTPYYINLASPDQIAIKNSLNYIEQVLKVAKIVNSPFSEGVAPHSGDGVVSRLVIHIGSQCDLARDVAIENCKKNLNWVIAELRNRGYRDFLLCIETMGRYKAIGNHQEICDICKIHPCVVPVLDFGHINCIEQGELQKNPERMGEIVEYCIAQLGMEKMRHVHIHFSAIKYSERGEHAHTTLDDQKWAFPFEPLARAIKKNNLEPTIICESQDIMAQDAQKLLQIWVKTCHT